MATDNWKSTSKKISEAIEIGMIQRGLNRQQLADRCGIPYSSLCRKLNNPSLMSLAELALVMSALGKEIEVKNK